MCLQSPVHCISKPNNISPSTFHLTISWTKTMHTLKNWQHQTHTPHAHSSTKAYINSFSRIYPRTRHYFPCVVGNFSISTIDLPTCGVYACIKLLMSIDLPTIMLTINVQSHTRTLNIQHLLDPYNICQSAINNPTPWIPSLGPSRKLILTHPSSTLPFPSTFLETTNLQTPSHSHIHDFAIPSARIVENEVGVD